MFSLILFSTIFILLFLPLYFGNLVLIFISIPRKLHLFVCVKIALDSLRWYLSVYPRLAFL